MIASAEDDEGTDWNGIGCETGMAENTHLAVAQRVTAGHSFGSTTVQL